MKKLKGIQKIVGITLVTTFVIGFTFYGFVSEAEPGTDVDPLVSQSYVDSKITTLTSNITQLTTKIIEQEKIITQLSKNSTGSSGSFKFEVVQLKKGQKIIGQDSTELILRSGNASAITSRLGGMSDLTTGYDITSGKSIPAQHLILIPRDDGRGFNITSVEAYILVKGGYTVQ